MIHGYQIVALMWTGIILTLVLVLTRLYVRVQIRGGISSLSAWKWSEVFVIFAWLIFLFQGICMTIQNSLNYLKFDDPNFHQTADERESSHKINWIANAVYMLCMYSVKAAMLCFYNEVVARTTLTTTKIAIRVIGFFVFAGAVISSGLLLFGCWPISLNWSRDPEKACAPVWNIKIDITLTVFHLTTDLMVWSFPFFLLGLVKGISRKEKISAALMFALGTFCMFCAAFVQATNWWDGITGRIATLLGFIVEMTTAVAVACAPAFKSFIKGTKTVKSTVSSAYSSKRTADSSNSNSISRGGSSHGTSSEKDQSTVIDTVMDV